MKVRIHHLFFFASLSAINNISWWKIKILLIYTQVKHVNLKFRS